MEVLGRVVFHGLPPFAIVKFHPVILSIFDLAGVLERLREQLAQVVVVWSVFEPQISDVAQVFAKLLCHYVQLNIIPSQDYVEAYQDILRTDL